MQLFKKGKRKADLNQPKQWYYTIKITIQLLVIVSGAQGYSTWISSSINMHLSKESFYMLAFTLSQAGLHMYHTHVHTQRAGLTYMDAAKNYSSICYNTNAIRNMFYLQHDFRKLSCFQVVACTPTKLDNPHKQKPFSIAMKIAIDCKLYINPYIIFSIFSTLPA